MARRILFVNAIDHVLSNREFEDASEQLGFLYLVSSLRKVFGPDHFEIRIIDRDLERHLEEFEPDLVGISAVTQNFGIARLYASTAKSHGSSVIIGGVHMSAMPSSLTGDMDVGVVGEGEETIVDLMELWEREGSFENRDELSKIDGIAYRNGENIELTPPRAPIRPLDRIPLPARDLSQNPTKGILTSRGCPYNCSYCFSKPFWQKVRYHSVAYVLDEITEIIDEHAVDHISIYDDLFASDRKRFRALADDIERQGINRVVAFNCNVRANEINDETTGLLKKMNVTSVFLGIESGSQRILDYLKGGSVTVEQNRQAVRTLKKHGIRCTAGFIIGSPDETREEILTTLDFAKSLPLDNLYIFLLTPLPGTPVWEYALERGLVSEAMDWSILRQEFGEVPDRAVILSERLAREELHGLYQAFVKHKSKLIAKSARRAMLQRYAGISRRGLYYLGRHPLLFWPKLWKTVASFLRGLFANRPKKSETSQSGFL